MDDENVDPINLSDNDAPFAGPNPARDELVSTRPETDGEIDEQELYDEGLAGAAEIDDDGEYDSEETDLPDGFHVE